ncbi:MAG: SMP-30/gluconolactonase/LRE family protein [Acidimicrobiia bacterium]|nr:SMP-30/gluconolactonase/LRE family protein [Acidimicrobiia bacterium]
MIFATGLGVPEGPVLMPDGGWLVVEMSPDRGCVTRLGSDGKIEEVLARTGRPNGLAVDALGNVWIAESQKPSLLKLYPDGTVETFLTECDGDPFLFPNDLAFGPDGALFLTDSGILFDDFAPGGVVRSDWNEVPVDGRVYRIDVETKAIKQVDTGIRFTNGVAIGTDGMLYSNETMTGNIFRYSLDGEHVGPRELFGNVLVPSDDTSMRGPDGMKFAANGDLYVTVVGQGDVTVLDTAGEVKNRIPTDGNFPTNVAFGPPGSGKIFVTEDAVGTMEVFDVGIDGAVLYDGTLAIEGVRRS